MSLKFSAFFCMLDKCPTLGAPLVVLAVVVIELRRLCSFFGIFDIFLHAGQVSDSSRACSSTVSTVSCELCMERKTTLLFFRLLAAWLAGLLSCRLAS